MEQQPHPLDYATPTEPRRSMRWAVIGVVVLLAIGLVAALFGRVQVTPMPAPTMPPPAATQTAAPSSNS